MNSVASKNAIAVRTSSSGEGTTVRRSEVRHRIVISSRSRRRIPSSSAGVRRGSSSRSSSAASRRSATRSVRRRASVGCAVRTGEIASRSIARVEVGVGSTHAPQPADGVGKRAVQHPAARDTCAPGQGADPLPLLGEVHQLEVERERSDDGLGPVEVQRGELVGELLALERIVRPAERDHPLANALDELEQLGAGLLRDDLAKQRPEQADLGGEGVAGAGRSDARRLGANCRGGSRAPAGRLPVGHAAVLHGP